MTWPGSQPPSQARVPLGTLVRAIEAGKSVGGSAPPATPDQWGIIKVSAMTSGVFRPEENKAVPAGVVNPRFEIQAGDLLVSRANTAEYVGASVYVGATRPRLLLSDKSLRLVLRDGVDPRWLQLMLSSPAVRTQISRRATGTKDSMRNISQTALLSIEVPLVSLDEQSLVVNLLDDHLSRLDAADSAVRMASARLPALRMAALRQMVGKLRATGVPFLPLGSICGTTLGKMLDRKRATGVPTPYLRNINVRWGHVDTADVKMVPLSEAELSSLALQSGDVLVCEGGEPGRCAVWTGSDGLMAFQKALHRVRVDPDVLLPEFVAAVIEGAVRSGEARRLLTGTTIKHLPQERLRELPLPVPGIAEQQAYVTALREIEDYEGRLRVAVDHVVGRTAALRRALLDAAFLGRLTGQATDLDRVGDLVGASQ